MNRALIGCVLLGLSLSAGAEVHRCKDAAGKIFFSDRGCPGGERMRGAPGGADHTTGTPAGDNDVAQRCLEQFRQHGGIGSADDTRVESYRVRWVTVRDVGARRLFNITVGVRNPAGYWSNTTQHDCLLRGDNVTFQTTPYELVN